MALKTDYKDDILNAEVNENRKYRMITNDDGTVSFIDATEYSQVGDEFGAQELNEMNNDLVEVSEQSALNAQTLGYSKKNLLKNTAKSVTRQGIAFTVNSDGSVNGNGTSTSGFTTCFIDINSDVLNYLTKGKKYIVSANSTSSFLRIYGLYQKEGSTDYIKWFDPIDTEIEVEVPNDATAMLLRIVCYSTGSTLNNAIAYPMIRDARITDLTYEPHVDDVDTRIAQINSDLEQQVLTFTNKTVATSAWTESTDEDFPYYADVACSGVTENYVPTVNFSLADANSGIFSTVCESVSGAVRIYASEKPTATVTIPTIQCIKSV